MSKKISLSQAFAQWQDIAGSIPKDDGPALAESWNDYTDSLAKDGQLGALQYHYCPAYDEPMPGEGSRFDPLRDDRKFILERMGVTLEAEFVPFSRSRNKGEKSLTLNWRLRVLKDGREVIVTDYSQGCAHCPAYKNPPTFADGRKDEYSTRQAIRHECETGRAAHWVGSRIVPKGKPIDPPGVADVFYSLLLDADAIDYRDFGEWCDAFGYDNDSITARGIYDACLATGLKLRAAFGDKTLRDLRELFEDM